MIVPSACMGSPTVPISVQCSTRKKYRAQQPATPWTSLSDLNSRPAGTVSEPARGARPLPLGSGSRVPRVWLSSPRISFVTLSYAPLGKLRRQDRDMRTPPRRFRGAQLNGDKTACVRKRERAHTCHLSPTPSSPLNWKAGLPRPLPPTEQGPRRSAWRADAAWL